MTPEERHHETTKFWEQPQMIRGVEPLPPGFVFLSRVPRGDEPGLCDYMVLCAENVQGLVPVAANRLRVVLSGNWYETTDEPLDQVLRKLHKALNNLNENVPFGHNKENR